MNLPSRYVPPPDPASAPPSKRFEQAVVTAPAPSPVGFLPAWVRGMVEMFAVCSTIFAAVSFRLSASDLVPILLGMGLLTLTSRLRLGGTTERPITLFAVTAFCLLSWFGAGVALPAILGASLMQFFWSRLPSPILARHFFHGATVIMACGGAAQFLAAKPIWIPVYSSWLRIAQQPADLLISGAFAFAALYALLLPLGNLGEWRAWQRDPFRSQRSRAQVLIMMCGLSAAVILSLLPPSEEVYAALSLLTVTLLAGQWVRQKRRAETLQAQINALHDIGSKSIAEDIMLDPSALLKKFLLLAQELVQAERLLIWTMDQEEHFLLAQIGVPDMGAFLNVKAPFADGLIGHAAAKLEPRLIPSAARDLHRRPGEPASGAWMLYPIVVNKRLLGLVQCIRSVHRPFTQEELARLGSLVPHVAVALENIRIREEMHLAASTDGLTGLWNHRKMQQVLRTELSRASRYNRALSVLMMDVDSFKTFNDTYGHPAGDQLLRSVATILQSGVRHVDHVGRYGGEEFMIILPETSKDAAYQLAERIRAAVEQQAHTFVKGERVQRTVSVGVASCPEDALNAAELVQRADEALYRAKHSGKNCVIWA
jgi:diguanylate cyclase (GGDEF)-like protein